MYHFVFLKFVNFQPKAIKSTSLFKLHLWGYYYMSDKIDTHVNITIWVTHQQALVSLAMRIIRKSFLSKRLFCNSVRISQSSFSFLLRPLCEPNAFCVIQLSRGTFFPWLSECHAPNVLWKAAGELGILEIPMKLPQAVPNSLCCFTLVISLPQTEEDQTSTDQRSQQLPNWIWSVSSLQQYRSKCACNGYFFFIPASYLHIYLLCVSSCLPALLFQNSCLRSHVSKICFMECLCQGWPHWDDKIYQLGWLEFIELFTKEFSLAKSRDQRARVEDLQTFCLNKW